MFITHINVSVVRNHIKNRIKNVQRANYSFLGFRLNIHSKKTIILRYVISYCPLGICSARGHYQKFQAQYNCY